MKFVTLALALFAVGCQAASLQADSPVTQLAHARGLMTMYLDQIKHSVDEIIEKISDNDSKMIIKNGANAVYNQINALRGSVEPVTDSVVATIDDATRDLRASIQAEIEALKADTEVKRGELREVIDKHVNEYRALLQPVLEDYRQNQEEQLAIWKAKFEPVMNELRGKIDVNVEETKAALMPIIEMVEAKLTGHIKNVKDMLSPYIEEYKEQLKAAYGQAQNVNYEEVKVKLQPHIEAVKASFVSLLEGIRGTMSQ